MLNIYFGELPEELSEKYIYNTNVYFNNTYKDRWITEPFSKEVIKAVDKSDVIDTQTILSPVFGNMSPKKLSGGTKTVLLIAYDPQRIFNASTCGDNCANWILQTSANRKVIINLHHLMDFGKDEFKIRILNTNKIVTNMGDLVWQAGEFV